MEKRNLNEICFRLKKTPNIDSGSNYMVSGYLKVIDHQVQKIDERELNEAH